MSNDFLTVAEVIVIHDIAVNELGGSLGVRDVGALESALMRPQMGYYDGIIEEAAAMMESLAMNHPFVDGNKRTAFYATDAFLRRNGSFIHCDNDAAHAFFMRMFDAGTFRFDELREWLAENVEQLPAA